MVHLETGLLGLKTIDGRTFHIEQVLTRGGPGKADVFVATSQDLRYVVKDFSSKGFWERNLIGRLLISREVRAYRGLRGINGIPKSFARLSPFTLAIEYIDARDLGSIREGEIGPEAISSLERIIDEIHERGWVHLDLQRRTNILIRDRDVFIIDLASAFHPGCIPILGRFITRCLGFFDRLSLIKLKKLYTPETLTESEKKMIRLRNLVMPTKW